LTEQTILDVGLAQSVDAHDLVARLLAAQQCDGSPRQAELVGEKPGKGFVRSPVESGRLDLQF